MRFVGFLSFITVIGAAFGADDVVEMPPFRDSVSLYNVYFSIRWERDTDTVAEIRIKEIKPGSQAEKLGLKAGDFLTAINGEPVVGRKRADIVNQNHEVMLRHTVTFSGHRGFFRKDWSITIDSALLRKKEPTAPSGRDSTER
jgi:hypothetical protein